MTDSVAATDLLRRWQSGDEEAANQLFQIYSSKLTGLAGKHLSDRLARRADSEDVIQSVMRTFFNRSARGEFNINNSGELWRLLVTITLAKVRDLARRHTAAKRDVQAEVGGGSDWMLESLAGEPGPVEAAALVDQIETILRGLPDAHGEILALALAGYSRTEVAEKMKVSRQTVYRVLTLLRERLEHTELTI